MITYYLDATIDPQHPRLVRRINNGHPTTFDNTLGTAVAMDIENLQLSYDISNGTNNPGNVKMTAADADDRAPAPERVRADADPQGQHRATGRNRNIVNNRTALALPQHAASRRSPARHGVRGPIPVESNGHANAGSEGQHMARSHHETSTDEADESGIALMTALLACMLASALMAGMFAARRADQRSHAVDRDQSQAYAAAHAGLEKLTSGLAQLFVTDFSPSAAQIRRASATSRRASPASRSWRRAGRGSGYAVTFNADTARRNAGNPLPSASNDITTGPFTGFKGLITPYTLTVTARSTAAAPKCGCGAKCRQSPYPSSSSASSARRACRSMPAPTSTSAAACTPTSTCSWPQGAAAR